MLLLTFAECSHCAQHCYKNHVCNLTYASKQLGIIIIIIIIIIDSQDYKTEAKWGGVTGWKFAELVSSGNLQSHSRT